MIMECPGMSSGLVVYEADSEDSSDKDKESLRKKKKKYKDKRKKSKKEKAGQEAKISKIVLPSAAAALASATLPKFITDAAKQEKLDTSVLIYDEESSKSSFSRDDEYVITPSLPTGGESDVHAVTLASRKELEETAKAKKSLSVRQKNKAKMAKGQATFTLKSNRDCPDIWQGGEQSALKKQKIGLV
eukprot:gb/GEZN01022695.1/.p1 GENE.gb/GEZN01022695.1/~~gb/GEZN01022695.1/.p1  ORF type:complete len:188 (+),score=41.78 gb/GEZN01022695.1/:40-603(+)